MIKYKTDSAWGPPLSLSLSLSLSRARARSLSLSLSPEVSPRRREALRMRARIVGRKHRAQMDTSLDHVALLGQKRPSISVKRDLVSVSKET
jgi:hypothetical protein